MTARTGTCSGCDAKYKIPETFKGTKAKCKKCGGVVEIPPLEEVAAQPAPEPVAAPAAAVRRGGRKSAARGRGGAASARRKPSRRRGADDEEEGGSKTWIWVVAGVSAVAIVVILVMMMSGGDDEPRIDDLATINETPEAIDESTDSTDGDGTEPTDNATDETTETTEPEEVDETTEETTTPAEIPEEIDPVIKLDILPPIIGCEQEMFDRLTECFTDGFVKQELPPWKRKTLMKEFEEADFEKIPIFLNAFNGLDLLKSDHVVVAFRVAEMWNKLTGIGFVDVPIKGDTTEEEMEANLDLNVKNIYTIYNIWQKKVTDVDAQREFFAKCEKYRRKADAKEAEDG